MCVRQGRCSTSEKRVDQSMNPSVPFGPRERRPMTLCPVALAVGCEKCPLFKFCPLKTVLGDQKKGEKEDSSRPED